MEDNGDSPVYFMVAGYSDNHRVSEHHLNKWWTNEHLVERLHHPGFISASRWLSPDPNNTARKEYLAWYVVRSPDTLKSEEYRTSLENPTPDTIRYMQALTDWKRAAYAIHHNYIPAKKVVKPSEGNVLLLLTFYVGPDTSRDMVQEYDINHLQSSVLTALVLRRRDDYTQLGVKTKSYDGVHFRSEQRDLYSEEWILFLEYGSNTPRDKIDRDARSMQNFFASRGARIAEVKIFSHIVTMESKSERQKL